MSDASPSSTSPLKSHAGPAARLFGLTRRLPVAATLALALGGIATLGFSPFNDWPCALLALIGLFFLWEGVAPKRAFLLGWLFGLGHFTSGLYWLYVAIHLIGGAPVWLAVFIGGILIVYLSLYSAVLGYASARWGQRFILLNALLLLPAGWTFLELVRGWALTGFPWLSLGYAFTDTPVAKFAPLGGVHAMDWAAALAAGGLWLVLRGPGRARIAGVVAVAVLAALVLSLPAPTVWTQPAGKPVRVAAVTINIAEKQKWEPDQLLPTLKQYYQMTAETKKAKMVVWPEAAVPTMYQDVKDNYVASLRELMHAHRQSLIFGILSARNGPGGKTNYYNTAHVVGESHGVYLKRHLVPYGEYFPVPQFVRSWLRQMQLPFINLTAGPPRQPLPNVAGEPTGLSICYEDIFGNEMRRDLPRARWLVNITNDAWFGRSTGLYQHLQIARVRALESGRDMLISANTGFSAMINSDGSVVKRSPRFKPAVMRASMTPRRGATPYVRLGNAPVWIA